MLSKRNRLTKSEFENIFKKGGVLHSPFFILRYIKNNKKSNYAISVVVPKKVSKKAADRNKIRRRYYYILKKIEPKIDNKLNAVLIIKKTTQKDVYSDTEKAVIEFFLKNGLMRR